MFSTDNLILWLSYALLVAALLTRTTKRMRLLIAAAGLAILARAVLLADYAGVGWMLVLLAVWLIKLWGERLEGRKIRFTPVEDAMRRTFLSALPRGAARQFIDQGLWLRGVTDDVLTNEGEPVTNLYYLVSGGACATIKGGEVGICRAGDLIGEATILSDEDATATVTLTEPSTFWCASTSTLRQFLGDHEGLRGAMERSFPDAVKDRRPAASVSIAGVGRAPSGQAAASL
jgi:CRP-like cAMP-binding protein